LGIFYEDFVVTDRVGSCFFDLSCKGGFSGDIIPDIIFGVVLGKGIFIRVRQKRGKIFFLLLSF